jgi:hypothetical protein
VGPEGDVNGAVAVIASQRHPEAIRGGRGAYRHREAARQG